MVCDPPLQIQLIVLMPEVTKGSAIYLYGGGNSSYQVSLDNSVQNLSPPSGDLLYSSENLPIGTHYVNLTALPTTGQQLVFDKAVITDGLPDG